MELAIRSATHTEFRNPQASLLGLPPELRLLVYEYLFQSVPTHIDLTGRFIWSSSASYPTPQSCRRLCQSPDPQHPYLCTKPPFSGLCSSNHRCCPEPSLYSRLYHKETANPLHRGLAYHVLSLVCKQFHQEIRGLDRVQSNVFSLEMNGLEPFFKGTTKALLENVTHLTIVPRIVCPFKWSNSHDTDIHRAIGLIIHVELPALQTLAVQVRRPLHKLRAGWPDFASERGWRGLWFVKALEKRFVPRVTVVVEVWMVVRPGQLGSQNEKDEMVRLRGVVHRGEGRVETDVFRADVVEDTDDAKWKDFWEEHYIGYGRKMRST